MLFVDVCRHFFLHGIFEGLRRTSEVFKRRRDGSSSSTLPIYRHASHLESIGEFDEARRLFQLVCFAPMKSTGMEPP